MIRDKLKIAVKTYNKIAKIYSKFTFHKVYQYPLNKFISMIPKKAKVLDAGCGSGRDAQYFKEYGFEVTAIDAAEKMVEEAKKNVKGVKFKKMDMMKTDFKDKTFEGVWAAASLLNNEKKNIPKILAELKRILNDEGVLYISVKEGGGEEIRKVEKYNNEPIPFFYYTLPEMEELVKGAGFQILHSGFSDDAMKRKDTKWIDIYCKKTTS
ncbi:MAG: class I SAM-dependent methyltransferase [Nanoarchaeota archaeon]|nr:class I SAM-dependent methyltransferase [Nanoarchaeota archaeon]